MDNLITGERIADLLSIKGIDFEQKKMFGGLCFLVDDKMLAGTYKGGIMARVSPDEADRLAEQQNQQRLAQSAIGVQQRYQFGKHRYAADGGFVMGVNVC